MSRQFFHIRNKRSGTLFLPTSVSGIKAWFDVNDITTVIKDGSNLVSQLNDKSGNGYNVAQSTGVNKPLYVFGGGANDRPYISFTSGKLLNNPSFPLSQPFTLYLAVKSNGIVSGTECISLDSGSVTGVGYYTDSSTTNTLGDLFSCTGGLRYLSSRANYSTDYRILKFTFDDTHSICRVNSELDYVRDYPAWPSIGTNPATRLQIGKDSSFYFHEMIIYSGLLSDSDDAAINDYLRIKYNTVNSDYIAWFGDSITAGYYSTDRNRKSYAALVSDEKGKNLYNYGVPGTYIAPDATDFSTMVNFGKKAHNGWCVIGYGFNNGAANSTDPTWKPTYKGLIQQLIDVGYDTHKMIITSIVYTGASWEPTLNTTIAQIASEMGLTYGNIYDYMYANGGLSLLYDGVHPNDTGHRVIADYLKTLIS